MFGRREQITHCARTSASTAASMVMADGPLYNSCHATPQGRPPARPPGSVNGPSTVYSVPGGSRRSRWLPQISLKTTTLPYFSTRGVSRSSTPPFTNFSYVASNSSTIQNRPTLPPNWFCRNASCSAPSHLASSSPHPLTFLFGRTKPHRLRSPDEAIAGLSVARSKPRVDT